MPLWDKLLCIGKVGRGVTGSEMGDGNNGL